MQWAGGVRFDIERESGLWYYRFQDHRMGPFKSHPETAAAGKKFLYCLYLRRLRMAALAQRPRRIRAGAPVPNPTAGLSGR